MTNQPTSQPSDDPTNVQADSGSSTAPGIEPDEPDREANPDDEDTGFDPMGTGEDDVDPDDDREEDYL